jgi:hypothetical protein
VEVLVVVVRVAALVLPAHLDRALLVVVVWEDWVQLVVKLLVVVAAVLVVWVDQGQVLLMVV